MVDISLQNGRQKVTRSWDQVRRIPNYLSYGRNDLHP
jgi:hypothetical protein